MDGVQLVMGYNRYTPGSLDGSTIMKNPLDTNEWELGVALF